MADKKFDIFETLDKISKKDIKFFDNLPEHESRQMSPLVLMKWMTGTKNKLQVTMVNTLVNMTCFSLYKHPKLMYKLLMVSSTSKGRVSWLKRKSKEKETEILKVISEYYDCSFCDAASYRNILTHDNILDMADTINIDKEHLTKLKKELNEQ
jgi:hypothetical protein